MKKHILDFLHRGSVACGLGPVVLAVIYLCLPQQMDMQMVSVKQVCVEILSIAALAFIAGGMNAIYQVERLPLMAAILIHGVILYGCYLGVYLLNSWLEWGIIPVLVFTGIFVVGFFVIWAIIYSIIKRNTEKINEMLEKRRM